MNRTLLVPISILLLSGVAVACPHAAPASAVSVQPASLEAITSPVTALVRFAVSDTGRIAMEQVASRRTGPGKTTPPAKKPAKPKNGLRPMPGNVNPIAPPPLPRGRGPGGSY